MPAQMGYQRPSPFAGARQQYGRLTPQGAFQNARNQNRSTFDMAGILNQGREFLNPMGSDQINRGLEQYAMRNAESRRNRGQGLASLAGLDPLAQRQAFFDIDNSTGQDTANFLNDARFQQMMGNQDWVRSLFGGNLDYERQRQLLKQEQKQQGGVGGMIGGVLGAAVPGLGGLFGGGGMMGGAPRFGAAPKMGAPGFRYPVGSR